MDLMNQFGHGLKLFSFCALALGLMAFSATAAQAEGTWMVNGKNLTSTTENKELTGSLVAPGGKLLTTLGLNKVTFSCTAGQLLNAKLEPEGKISETSKNAKVDFSGCTTEINGKVATACEPIDGATKGVILSEEGYALLKLHELKNEKGELIGKDGVTVITPNNVGKVFAIIHMSKVCAIGESVEVFGELALVDTEGNAGLITEKETRVVKEFAPLTKLTVANKESSAKATLDGEAEVKLSTREIWNGLFPEEKTIGTTYGEEEGNPRTGINGNPFDLPAIIIAIFRTAAGAILGGTCVVGGIYFSLEACTVIQDKPVGSVVVWWPL